MTTSKKDASLASKQLRTAKSKTARSVAGSDLAQAKGRRPASRQPAPPAGRGGSPVRERQSSYRGRVEIWIDDEKIMDADVHLAGYVEVHQVQTSGGLRRFEGRTSWGGYLVGASQHQRNKLIGLQLDLKFPNGQTGRAVLDGRSALHGVRETPF